MLLSSAPYITWKECISLTVITAGSHFHWLFLFGCAVLFWKCKGAIGLQKIVSRLMGNAFSETDYSSFPAATNVLSVILWCTFTVLLSLGIFLFFFLALLRNENMEIFCDNLDTCTLFGS